MRRILGAGLTVGLTLTLCGEARAGPPIRPHVVYGDDDRMEAYAISSPALLAAADASAALLFPAHVSPAPGGGWDLDAFALGTFGEFFDLCPAEPFHAQPAPALCSGFKVGPDLIATAGHCIATPAECTDSAFVFDFEMLAPGVPPTHVDAEDVYFCTQIVDRVDAGTQDWAVVRVDRAITGHPALPLRRSGAVESDSQVAGLFDLGYPGGIPLKVIGGPTPVGSTGLSGATVKAAFPDYFETNLDVYVGNSGSVVVSLDAQGELVFAEGIIVRGFEDFTFNLAQQCFETRICPDSVGCPPVGGFEEATRVELLLGVVPPLCGNGQVDAGEPCDPASGGPACTPQCQLQPLGVPALPPGALATLALLLLALLARRSALTPGAPRR